jgi:hypothetical protein
MRRYLKIESTKSASVIALWLAIACLLAGAAVAAAHAGEPKDLLILQKWSGDYPVVYLNRLPEGQQRSGVGFIGDEPTFRGVWEAFKPGEKVPEVDFTKELVVFSRNVVFYNRTSIAKVALRDGVAEVIASETRSSLPIEDKVAMAVAVIPRAGVKFIQAGEERVPVSNKESALDPLNASYPIEGRQVHLINGHGETEATPGSATKIKTSVFGKPVYGDLDGDGKEDAALLLVYDPGGSGTFYYVAAAVKVNGAYRGTNGVLLGDRIAPKDVRVRNGVVTVNYADRRPEEAMSASPSVGKSQYLVLKSGKLVAIKPPGAGEQVVEGWVTIGHEVRSFVPCSGKSDLWLAGNAPALNEIMAAYRQARPSPQPYAPVFMVLVGRYAGRPVDGFGAAYEAAFFATELVQVWRRGNCKSGYIVIDSPAPGALVTSPLRVQGSARGTWFFEGDFPLILTDARGNIIAKGFATAKREWMTEDFVPFEGNLHFTEPSSGDKGTLIFKKNNPTGLAAHDDALEIPVLFK